MGPSGRSHSRHDLLISGALIRIGGTISPLLENNPRKTPHCLRQDLPAVQGGRDELADPWSSAMAVEPIRMQCKQRLNRRRFGATASRKPQRHGPVARKLDHGAPGLRTRMDLTCSGRLGRCFTLLCACLWTWMAKRPTAPAASRKSGSHLCRILDWNPCSDLFLRRGKSSFPRCPLRFRRDPANFQGGRIDFGVIPTDF
jgi:hypothetical protein